MDRPVGTLWKRYRDYRTVISGPEFFANMDPDQEWSQLQSLVMVEAKWKRAGWKAGHLLKVLSQ